MEIHIIKKKRMGREKFHILNAIGSTTYYKTQYVSLLPNCANYNKTWKFFSSEPLNFFEIKIICIKYI